MFGRQGGVAPQAGAEIPQRSGREPLFRVRPLWRMKSVWPPTRRHDTPLPSIVHGGEISKPGFGFAVERGGECVDQPVGHLRQLRREKALSPVELAQQKLGAQRRAEKGPDVGAQVLGPSSSQRVPRFDRRPGVETSVQLHAFFPHVRPSRRLGVIGKQKGHRRWCRLDVREEVRMSAQ